MLKMRLWGRFLSGMCMVWFVMQGYAYASNPFTKVQIWGGEVNNLSLCAAHPAVIYAGSSAGGLWVSKDSGETWTETKLWNKSNSGPSALVAHPDSPNIVIVKANSMLRSEDYGETWADVSSVPGTLQPKRMVVSPADHSTFYLAGYDNSESCVYKSVDGGKTWTKLTFTGSANSITDMDVSQSGAICVCTVDAAASSFPKMGDTTTGKVYKSIDGGATWLQLSGITAAPWYIATSQDTLAVACATNNTGGGSCVYASTNTGTTFTTVVSGANVYVGGIFSVAISTNGTTMFYCEGNTSNIGGYRIVVSSFSGTAWSSPVAISTGTLDGKTSIAAYRIVIDPTNPGNMYVNDALEFGVVKSTDAGNNWYISNKGIASLVTYDGAKGPQGYMYVLGRGNIYKSTDTAASWYKVFSSSAGGAYGAFDGGTIATNPDPARDYVYAVDKTGLVRSIDGGLTWNYVLALPITNGVAAKRIVFGKSTPATGYVAFSDVNVTGPTSRKYIYKTTDYGQTWAPVNLQGLSVQSLAIDPQDPTVIYAGLGEVALWSNKAYAASDNGLWKIVDDGASVSWSKVGLNGKIPYRIAIDTTTTSVMYTACIENFTTTIAGGPVYVSQDKGVTWSETMPNIWGGTGQAGSGAMDIAYSYPAFFFSVANGVYASIDNGASGTQIAQGTDVGTVRALMVGSLYAGANTGLWKLTSLNVSSGTATTTYSGGEVKTYSFPNPYNPKTSATPMKIKLTLPRAVNEVTIRIYSLSGELVFEASSGNIAAGSALSVDWDGKNGNGTLCAPGLYFIVADAGGTRVRNKIVLAY